jgi:hypothetical protein
MPGSAALHGVEFAVLAFLKMQHNCQSRERAVCFRDSVSARLNKARLVLCWHAPIGLHVTHDP